MVYSLEYFTTSRVRVLKFTRTHMKVLFLFKRQLDYLPPSKIFPIFQVNYSKTIQNSLKYCMRDRHIESAILNFEILTSDS